jgi:hypothetical protein
MRFDRAKDPAAVAPRLGGSDRYRNAGAALVKRGECEFLAATDGRALTFVRAYPDDDDTPDGVYPSAAFTAARKAGYKKADASLTLNGSAHVAADGAVTEFTKVEGLFPDVNAVVPTGAYRSISVNAEYLAKVQKALGADAIEVQVYDEAGKVPLVIKPIYLHGGRDDGSFGVVMPIASKSKPAS